MAGQPVAAKEPFEAFGILYYPVFDRRSELEGTEPGDAALAWAVTASENLAGTGYALSQASILALAAYREAAGISAQANDLINPLADLTCLVPTVSATPLYPDFPSQVMAIPEAQFRLHQALHYLSTYGVEELAGARGLNVVVREGWRPQVVSTPKTRPDEALVAPKVVHVLLCREDLYDVVAARFARATRMHPAELACALLVLEEAARQDGREEPPAFPPIAFHENMLALIDLAAEGSAAQLERTASALAQHPGDLYKATCHLAESSPRRHLATRQKKALCRALERFSAASLAQNLADAGRDVRLAPNYLSPGRFGGPRLREAVALVESGQVRSWASEVERLWEQVGAQPAQPDAWQKLLAVYGQRPGMLLRSLVRLAKHGCPPELLREALGRQVGLLSLPTIVRTLTMLGERAPHYRVSASGYGLFSLRAVELAEEDLAAREQVSHLLRELLVLRLRTLDTPLAGKRVHVDTQGISLVGSALVPNETGNTGTAWPPAGIAWELPASKTVRFFCYWDERERRVDVDLHFVGLRRVEAEGEDPRYEVAHVGWSGDFRSCGMVTSGDVTTSEDAVEFLDVDIPAAREDGVQFVVQHQHIYEGAESWGDISTCYAGALVVGDTAPDVALVDAKNLLFRDDLTGEGRGMAYAVVSVAGGYVRLLRGSAVPLGDLGFSVVDYLALLFEAQGATRVERAEEADVRLCVGRSDDASVISLFDESFFVR